MNEASILILGAHGPIARVATELFVKNTNARLTLCLRDAGCLRWLQDHPRIQIVDVSVTL